MIKKLGNVVVWVLALNFLIAAGGALLIGGANAIVAFFSGLGGMI